MRQLLILIMIFAVFTGCVANGDSSDCTDCETDNELIDVIISVYYNPEMGDTYKLVAMLPDGSQKKVIYDVILCGIKDPVIGCDGRTLLFADMCSGQGIYSLYIPTTRLSLLYSDECCAMFSNPIFSPDMKEIFMIKGFSDLAVLNLSTRLVTNLAHSHEISPPSITADGKHLVFVGKETRVSQESGEPEEFQGIFTMDPDQRNLKMVKPFDPIDGKNVAFSYGISVIPATSEIIYALNLWTYDDYEGIYNIYKMNIDGTGQTLLLSTEQQISNLSSNRRGNQILFFTEDLEPTVNVAHFQGSTMTEVVAIEFEGESVVRSPRFTVINRALFNTLPDLVIP